MTTCRFVGGPKDGLVLQSESAPYRWLFPAMERPVYGPTGVTSEWTRDEVYWRVGWRVPYPAAPEAVYHWENT